MYNQISTLILYISMIILTAGCHKTAEANTCENSVAVIMESDSVPDGVKKLVKTIADNDSTGFSDLVSYPLERPYPLHDIENSDQMREYYSTMVDDSLRKEIVTSKPMDWGEYGWRGWALKDGNLIWIDSDKISMVPYLSKLEKQKQNHLINKEMQSIAPSMRKGWNPVIVYENPEDGTIYRIDVRNKEKKSRDLYRLSEYKDRKKLREKPSRMLEGSMETEGTVMTYIYRFKDKNGEEIEIDNNDMTTGKPVLIMPSDSSIELRKIYWLDVQP